MDNAVFEQRVKMRAIRWRSLNERERARIIKRARRSARYSDNMQTFGIATVVAGMVLMAL